MKRYLVPTLLFVGTLFFGFLYFQDPVEIDLGWKQEGASVPFEQLEQMKRETQVKISLDQQRARLEKSKERKMLSPGARARGRFHETPDHLPHDPRAQVVLEPSREESLTLDQQMDAFLARKEQYEQMERAQQEAYVESFIREARNMGFEVKISPDMQIQSIEKIGE